MLHMEYGHVGLILYILMTIHDRERYMAKLTSLLVCPSLPTDAFMELYRLVNNHCGLCYGYDALLTGLWNVMFEA